VLREARSAHDRSRQDVAERAGCSAGYVHKLESDKVATPSPRVGAGLADALGLAYDLLMSSPGCDAPADTSAGPVVAGAIKRDRSAPIVELLEHLRREVRALRVLLDPTASPVRVD